MEPSPTLFADPLVPAQPKLRRRVGRPKGSKGRVMQGARVLGAHHFAFVRESLLGLDLAEAFHRYLAWSDTATDVRHVQHRRDGLLEHIIDVQADADLTPLGQFGVGANICHSDWLVKSEAGWLNQCQIYCVLRCRSQGKPWAH